MTPSHGSRDMSEMPMPRRTPGHPIRDVAAALWVSLGCVLAGCHGIPSLPTPRYPCPGCDAAPDEPCGCTPDAISAGYHETRWRSIQPQESFPAGVRFETVPFHPPTRATTHGSSPGSAKRHRDAKPGLPEDAPEAPDPFPLVAPQSHQEPVPAIAASLDDELARYFFDLDAPPRAVNAPTHQAPKARAPKARAPKDRRRTSSPSRRGTSSPSR